MKTAIKFLEKNADLWEIYSVMGNYKSAVIEKGKIKNISDGVEEVYSVRVVKDGRIGFATTNWYEDLPSTCEKAIKLAKISEEKLEELPIGEESRGEGIYDKKVKDVDSKWMKEAIDSLIGACDPRVNPAQGSVSVSEREVNLISSMGTDLSAKGSSCNAYLDTVIEDSSGFEMIQSRSINIDFEFLGKRASELALNSLKARKIEPMNVDVILSPIAMSQLIYFTLFPSFSGENIVKGRSLLAGKIGENFGEFNLIDDGTITDGLFTSPFDDEGVMTQRKVIFDKGTLSNYIVDFKYSKVLNIEPTGNGFRDETNSYPSTSPSNVIFDFPERSVDIEGSCLSINSFIGAHTSNPLSGDFSLECQNSFLNEEPVKSAMMYGNIFDILKKIEVIGKDVRQIDNTISPSVRLRDISISA